MCTECLYMKVQGRSLSFTGNHPSAPLAPLFQLRKRQSHTCTCSNILPYLRTEMFLRALLPLTMIIGGSMFPSLVAASTIVSLRLSPLVDLTETVYAPLRLTVLLVVMSKYMGVSSMLTTMLSGYIDCFLASQTDRRKVAIFSSRAA